jgi:hypothetical protein
MENQIEMENDSVLCYLSDWQERLSESPRSKGESYGYRFAIAALTYSWAIVEFRKNGTHTYHKYATSLKDLCPYFRINAGLDIVESLSKINNSLSKAMQKNFAPKIKSSNNKIDVALDYAEQIDTMYQINYAIHDKIRERVFGEQTSST